jgi:hypothetical protein
MRILGLIAVAALLWLLIQRVRGQGGVSALTAGQGGASGVMNGKYAMGAKRAASDPDAADIQYDADGIEIPLASPRWKG